MTTALAIDRDRIGDFCRRCSFGAVGTDRPEATPRLYNVLEIARDLKSARVHTRCQPKPDGPWDGWYEWPDPDGGKGRVPCYDIKW